MTDDQTDFQTALERCLQQRDEPSKGLRVDREPLRKSFNRRYKERVQNPPPAYVANVAGRPNVRENDIAVDIIKELLDKEKYWLQPEQKPTPTWNEKRNKQLNESQSECEQLKNDLAESQSECEQLEDDLAKSQSESKQLKNDLTKSQSQYKLLQDKNGELTSRLKNFILEMRKRMDELEQTIGEDKNSEHSHTDSNQNIAAVVKKEPKDDYVKHEH